MPQGQPTIWDILGYEEEGTEYQRGSKQAGVEGEKYYDPGTKGGQLSYLADLLEKSGWMTDEMESPRYGEGSFYTDVHGEEQSFGNQYEEVMFKLSKMLGAPMEEFGGRDYGGGWGGEFFEDAPEDRWEEFIGSEDLNEFAGYQLSDMEKSIFEVMQEGLRATPTSESFGLGRKLGDIETGGKRELKSAREGYVPGEIMSRYGALQGKAGAQQKGEQLEQAYTSDIYGVQRGMGRDVRSTYEDFEDEWFGGVESWIGGLG
tara:strand:+ start:1848 stop:2627 length:780 start_codon:yes stop_codon:yes gene_type:complete